MWPERDVGGPDALGWAAAPAALLGGPGPTGATLDERLSSPSSPGGSKHIPCPKGCTTVCSSLKVAKGVQESPTLQVEGTDQAWQ